MSDRKIWEMTPESGNPAGFQQATVSSAAIGLPSLPTNVKRVLLRTNKQIRWRDDGTDPTTSVGMYLLADESLVYDAQGFTNFKMIATSVDATVSITYYS